MPEKIGLQAVLDDANFKRGVANYNQSVQGMVGQTDRAAKRIDQAFTLASVAIAGRLVKSMAASAYELGQLGAQSLRLRDSFEELARQAGGSADEMLGAIRRATGGTVAEMDIMLAANKGIMLGLGAQADQWEKLTEVARFRARAMGLTVTQALSDITTGIGRESRMILDNLGIILDLDVTMKDYARTLGTTANALSAAERKQAILNSVIEEGQAQISEAGGIQTDYADDMEMLNATLDNLRATLGEELAPAIAALARVLDESIPKLTATVGELAILEDAVTAAALAFLFGNDAMEAFNTTMLRGIGAYDDWVQSAHEAWRLTGLHGEALEETTEAIRSASDAARAYEHAWERAAEQILEWEKESAEAMEQAAQKMADAERKAARDRKKARSDLLDDLSDLERDHAEEVADLQQQLADDLADLLADFNREMADLDREYAQDKKEARRDLNRDLEDMERDHFQKMRDLEADYAADIEELMIRAEQKRADVLDKYGQKRADLEHEYAQDEADIYERYKELRIQELVRAGGDEEQIRADWTDDMLQGPLKEERDRELAQLKEKHDERLAELDAAMQRELDEIAKWLKREQEERNRAYERQRQEAQARYEEERAERKRQYQEELDDLKRQHRQREQEQQRRYAEEEAELQAHHQRQMAELEAQYAKDQAALKEAYDERIAEINTRLAEEQEDIKIALARELLEIHEGLAEQSAAYRAAYQERLDDLRAYLEERLDLERQYQQDLEALWETGSPSRWMERLYADIGAGALRGWKEGSGAGAEMVEAVHGLKASLLAERYIGIPPAPRAGGGGTGTGGVHAMNLSFGPTTINTGMDQALFERRVVAAVKGAMQYG